MIGLWVFFTVLVLVFALALLIGGAFTTYFGEGKSRAIGVTLLIIGVIIGLSYGWVAGKDQYLPENIALFEVVGTAFLYIIAAVIGAAIALAIVLAAMMKA